MLAVRAPRLINDDKRLFHASSDFLIIPSH